MMEINLDEESQSDEFEHYFEFIEYLASGSFGTVVRAVNLENNKEVAVKIIETVGKDKQKYINRTKQEIIILKQLKHKNIVELYGFIETNKQIFIIMEYIKGGNLKSLIQEKKQNNFSEEEVSLLIKNLLCAVEYLHSRDICHRDIKPENIMFENPNDLTSLKLVDFGLSAQDHSIINEDEICGTLIYMAPEQVEKKLYTKGIDMWSVGIIMYMLLNNGQHPLFKTGDTSSYFIEKLKNKDWSLKIKVSLMAKMLLSKLLEFNPTKRYSADRALNHPWITKRIYDDIPKTHLEMWDIRSLKNKFREFIAGVIFINKFSNNKEFSTKENFDKYVEIINQISQIKKIQYLKEREKCFEVIPTESNLDLVRENFIFKKSNRNDLHASIMNLNGQLRVYSNDACVHTESEQAKKIKYDLSPIEIIRARENIIKRSLKIKLIKQETASRQSENNSTQDGSPNKNQISLKSSASSNKLLVNKINKILTPEAIFLKGQKNGSPLSPFQKTNLNTQFKLKLNRADSKKSFFQFREANNLKYISPIKPFSGKRHSDDNVNILYGSPSSNDNGCPNPAVASSKLYSNQKYRKSSNDVIVPNIKISGISDLIFENINANTIASNRKISSNETNRNSLVLPEIKSPPRKKKYHHI